MDKITLRIEQLCDGLNMDFIDPVIKHCILFLGNRFLFFISFQLKVIIAQQLIKYNNYNNKKFISLNNSS